MQSEHKPPTLETLIALVEKQGKQIADLTAAVQNGNTEPDVAVPEVLITEAVEKWLLFIRQRFTPRTQIYYADIIHKFIETLPDIRYINEINANHVQDYLNKLLGRGLTNSTANGHLTVIKSFRKWAKDTYGIDIGAGKIKMLKIAPPRQRCLTLKQYDSILAACKSRKAKDLIITLGNTGLRATELAELTWDNINEDMTLINLVGKGRKRRIVPINSVVKEVLSRYPRQSGTHLQFSKPRRYQYRLISCLCKKIGIEKAGPHSLRHGLATQMIIAGASMTTVSRLMGHYSTDFTERQYCHLDPKSFLKGATEILCPNNSERSQEEPLAQPQPPAETPPQPEEKIDQPEVSIKPSVDLKQPDKAPPPQKQPTETAKPSIRILPTPDGMFSAVTTIDGRSSYLGTYKSRAEAKQAQSCSPNIENNSCQALYGRHSKYSGVYFHKSKNRWMAQIKNIYGGIFPLTVEGEKQAALACDRKAKELWGEDTITNQMEFPEDFKNADSEVLCKE